MAWMEPFLESGEIAGKITCPNKKCGAKLGNYDWAGVKCGCKEWVVPVRLFSSSVIQPLTTIVWQGFCINRAKVDEIVV
jgi:dual specificity phosphatase 12